MTPTSPQLSIANRPRVGIPWRTFQEELQNDRSRLQDYEDAVRKAGGEPVPLSLSRPAELQQLLPTLDSFVLPGSPADVAPSEYGAVDRGVSAPADRGREETDRAILKHALAEKKPVLAICYGCQLLNVYLGGTLIQDVRSETGTTTPHRKKDIVPEAKEDPIHGAAFDPGSRLAAISGNARADINSSHHQAVAQPGRNLRVTAHASDGTVEGIEWTGDSNWVVGVQWHPERMQGNAFAERLFDEFIAASARNTAELHSRAGMPVIPSEARNLSSPPDVKQGR